MSYDRAITVFSPDGQLLQVQYAQEAVRRGSAAVGVRGNDIVVLGVEKKSIVQLQEERTERKILALDDHILLAFAGLRADARVLVTRSQIECQSHRLTVEDPVTVQYITHYAAQMKQQYTQNTGRRPFGISCLIGGFDCHDLRPRLYQTEPSGTYHEWKAAATGRCDKTLREYLEANYKPEQVATERGAVKLAIKALRQVVQPGPRTLEIAMIRKGPPVNTVMLDQAAIDEISSCIQQEQRNAGDFRGTRR